MPLATASRQPPRPRHLQGDPEIALGGPARRGATAGPPPLRGHRRRRGAARRPAVSLSDQNGGNDRSRLELDEDGNKLPAPEPGTLTFLGPDDGKDSIQLPVDGGAERRPRRIATP